MAVPITGQRCWSGFESAGHLLTDQFQFTEQGLSRYPNRLPATNRRGTGKTLRMVQSLPASGGVLVVHDMGFRGYLSDMVRDVRGADFAKRWQIVIVRHEGDLTKLMGLSMPIEVDHAVWDHIGPATADALHRIVLSTARARAA